MSDEKNIKPDLSQLQVPPKENIPDSALDNRTIPSEGNTANGLQIGTLYKTWADLSRMNYLSSQPLDVIRSAQSSIRRRSIGLPAKEYSIQCFVPSGLRKSEEELFAEQFPVHVTPLMNEDQLWACFYTFPELYSDEYSPVVRIRNPEDVPETVGGVLTRDTVTTCLTYLKRTPILGDFVYIKCDLSSKHLINIDVLQHYKYLVYLDISSNLLTDLSVLSHLLYLQYLSVAFNRLNTVLEYDTPQWFLTEVHYKYNSVKKIRDLNMFWSITILDLSHNNIKSISGLESLRYLRRLDLSFNHIQRLENLNHLRLLWLDVSYNNISTFEFGPHVGLWTLLHLEYLNLNENNLKSMRMFSGCSRLYELHVRNNRLSSLLELAVYMRQMRRLVVLDMRANPICSAPGYQDVVLDTFPILLSLDATELDPVIQRSSRMHMVPDVMTFATRRLLRMLYVEQLSRARVSPHVPPADTTEVPLVVLVGYEAVGKGALARRLASECESKIKLARQHTTATFHSTDHYIEVSRGKFDDMLLTGDFLTYSEMDGESYGLCREEAFIADGKVRIVSMDLIGALMLKLRGRRPYLILATCDNKRALTNRQLERKAFRNRCHEQRVSSETPLERSTLQVLLSGRIIITGILNEIIVALPDDKEQSEFVVTSECSLFMDSDARAAARAHRVNRMALDTSGSSSLEEIIKQRRDSQLDNSLYSLYKESQATDEYVSEVNGQNSFQDNNGKRVPDSRQRPDKTSYASRAKSVDFGRFTSSTWKGTVPDSTKSSKSVTFTSQDNTATSELIDPMGLSIEQQTNKEKDEKKALKTISNKLAAMAWKHGLGTSPGGSMEDIDLWLTFLIETGLLQASDATCSSSENLGRHDTKVEDPDSIIRHLNYYNKSPSLTQSTNMRDDYEDIHRSSPGLFWDTVIMDNPDKAFFKVKKIIKDIINSQNNLNPMFDINFANLPHYPTVEKRLLNICEQIAPQRMFY